MTGLRKRGVNGTNTINRGKTRIEMNGQGSDMLRIISSKLTYFHVSCVGISSKPDMATVRNAQSGMK